MSMWTTLWRLLFYNYGYPVYMLRTDHVFGIIQVWHMQKGNRAIVFIPYWFKMQRVNWQVPHYSPVSFNLMAWLLSTCNSLTWIFGRFAVSTRKTTSNGKDSCFDINWSFLTCFITLPYACCLQLSWLLRTCSQKIILLPF